MASVNVAVVLVIFGVLNLFLWVQFGGIRQNYLQLPQLQQLSASNGADDMRNSLADVQRLLQTIESQLLEAEKRHNESQKAVVATQTEPTDKKPFDPETVLKDVRQFYQSQAQARHRNLQTIVPASNFQVLYNALAPEGYCMKRIRVGGVTDGGKWVCDPWSLPNNCTIVSLGLNNQVGFDDEFQQMTGNRCQILGYDIADQSQSTKDRYAKFRGLTKKAKIAAVTNDKDGSFAIADLVREAKATEVEILKIDIEGAEHTALEPFLKEFRVCQIYIEEHGNSHQMYTNLRMIAKYGYLLFSYEINGVGLSACEYSFIHQNCTQRYGVVPLAGYLAL